MTVTDFRILSMTWYNKILKKKIEYMLRILCSSGFQPRLTLFLFRVCVIILVVKNKLPFLSEIIICVLEPLSRSVYLCIFICVVASLKLSKRVSLKFYIVWCCRSS